MKGLFKTLVFCLLTFVVVGGMGVCWAVKLKNMAVPVYVAVDTDGVVTVTDDIDKAADFVVDYMCKGNHKLVMLMLAVDSNKVLGWTLDGRVVTLPTSTEILPNMLLWKYDAQNHTLCACKKSNEEFNKKAKVSYLGLDDGSLFLCSRLNDFSQWTFLSQ